MTLVDQETLDTYLAAGDWILKLLDETASPGDERFTFDRWLRQVDAKRLLFDQIYGDLLGEGPRRHVLDVGGGYSSLTRVLLARHRYELVDFMAHDDLPVLRQIEQEERVRFWSATDWYEHAPEQRDLVIANDVFPNVDQRLALFLDSYLPCSRELRLSLTYYPEPRFYVTRRVDADELLILLAWNGPQVRAALEPHQDRIDGERLDLLTGEQPASVFPNGRQVAVVTLRGDLS
jgi:hypothetical protein